MKTILTIDMTNDNNTAFTAKFAVKTTYLELVTGISNSPCPKPSFNA